MIHSNEDGFSLIELLVVILIIGILSAIAIPTFLSQRSKAWQATAASAAHNGALIIEAYRATHQGNTPDVGPNGTNATNFYNQSEIDDWNRLVRPDSNTTLTYKKNGTHEFKLCATHSQLPSDEGTVLYDSALGGIQDGLTTNTACN